MAEASLYLSPVKDSAFSEKLNQAPAGEKRLGSHFASCIASEIREKEKMKRRGTYSRIAHDC